MFMERVREIAREGRSVCEEDPRRVIHAFKVGLALVLVSSFYYYKPVPGLPDYFGINTMWAVMTVVVVFEFSVGATFSKGLNRGVATLVAGGLGFGAHQLASLSGRTVEPFILAIFVFVLAALSTFARFLPRVKARYDYGVLIFILTFALISLSGFRDEEVLDLAQSRLSTVMIGGISCILISIFVCPVWAGQDLHSLLASNVDTVSNFLQDFGNGYFEATDDGDIKDVSIRNFERYKSIIDSKSDEEALANFAIWEPPHGQFTYRHPWKQYLTVGALLRKCAYRMETLNIHIISDIQIPRDIKKKIEEPLKRMSLESGKSMKEVSISLTKMTKSSSSNIHVSNSQSAYKDLSDLLKTGILKDVEPLQMILLMTTISVFVDIVDLTEKISKAVHELASVARFKNKMRPTIPFSKSNSISIGQAKPIKSHDDAQVVTNLGGADTSKDTKDYQSWEEISVDSCHHVTMKIDDNDSIYDGKI